MLVIDVSGLGSLSIGIMVQARFQSNTFVMQTVGGTGISELG